MAKLKLYRVSGDGRIDMAVVTTSKVKAVALFNQIGGSYVSVHAFDQYGNVHERERSFQGAEVIWNQPPETVMVQPLNRQTPWVPATSKIRK